MARLVEVTRGAQVKGILPDGLVTVVDVQWHGSAVIELTYKDAAGHLGHELLFRDHEPTLEVLAQDGSGTLTPMADCSDWFLWHTAFAWPISLTPGWLSIPRSSNHCPTRLPPSMASG